MAKKIDPIKTISSKFVISKADNTDTDQILPGRFLTTTSREGMGDLLFYDWRYDESGNEIADCIFSKAETRTKKILVTGANFGCGSSREHAPWALYDYGFRVILSSEFADIFKNNALKIGLLPIVIDKDLINWLYKNENAEIEVDLEAKKIRYTYNGQNWAFNFEIDAFARRRLLDGMDELDFLLAQGDAIKLYEDSHA